MKILKSFIVLLMVGFTMDAQDINSSELPTVIQSHFKQAYNNATDIEWEKEMDHYQVEFEIDRMDYEVWYTSDGKQVKLEKELHLNELPTAIKSAIKKKYSDYSIDDCELREENGNVIYLLELEKWFDEIEVIYDANAKLLKEIK
ncbi:PepSY-like domain-containing protein [Mesonia mobilis]|uniref:PepSY-like domain-containing protein n=1 Tax=Mesonia mobilis TaxID=369791 RepID=UPI0026ED6073|nr:PepSY-like domain-containing protein [Mesonia mobilis]